MGIALAVTLLALPARDSADVIRAGDYSVGIVDPLRIGAKKNLEIVTHPIISTFMLSPNVQARVAFRAHPGGLRITGEYGLSVPTMAMRITSGYLFPSWKTSDNRVGWFVVPSVGVAVSYGAWTGRLDSAIGLPLGRNDATPLDTFAPIELIFAPALNGYRHHLGTIVDVPATDWLRVRGALDAWMIGPFEPPKSQLMFAASAGVDLRLSQRLRLSLGGILYNSDQRRQIVERGDDGRWKRTHVRSWDVYPTFDVIFTH